jgi:energy-coupling factor transport system ATP-binding protein
MSLIEIKGVDFTYNEMDEPALKDINLSIDEGDFVAIIGANGSGKSTLAKLLNVLLYPTQGKVYVSGYDTSNEDHTWDIRQKIGMVFQNPDNQLVATMVEDDIAFGPENLGIPSPEIRERVDHALDLVEMRGYQKHAPHKLSGGQKQRVAIAGVIAMEPSCIVLDEPTAMLDPQGRSEVIDTIYSLNQEKNITVVHITHFMEEALKADKIFVMDQGKIVNRGTPTEIFSDIEGLKEIKLSVPEVVELAAELRKEGYNIPEVLSLDGLVDALC